MDHRRLFFYFISIFVFLVLYVIYNRQPVINNYVIHNYISNQSHLDNFEESNFENFNNETGSDRYRYIVPNYVHFIRFNLKEMSFIDAVCILAAFKHQKPDRIYIHTNIKQTEGKYWQYLLENEELKKILIFKYTEVPDSIFGIKLSEGWRNWHSADIERIKKLMEYGGIFLDNDSYVVRSLDDLRKYEMSLGWMENSGLASQVIIANKNSRFLKKWLQSYKKYDKDQWYYNAGILPTTEILEKEPYLIHREKYLLANHFITNKLYLENWNEWRSHYAIHLLYNHQYVLNKNLSEKATYPVEFDENNILDYPVTIRDMVNDVYPLNMH